jgi:TRAP-type C4-dicarboxylate transport system permease small subunit
MQQSIKYSIIRNWKKLVERTSQISELGTMLMMMSIVFDVTMRYLFNTPIQGMIELNELLMVLIIFFALSKCQSRRANIRINILFNRFSERTRIRLNILAWVIGFITFLSITIFGLEQAFLSTLQNEVKWGVVKFPIWPGRIILAVGALMLSIQCFMDIFDEFRSFRSLDRANRKRR